MAKCDLSIELDDPDRIYLAGEKICGTLHVMVDADVRCKALEVTSGWRTHGRGNVARETTDSVTLFAGQWVAGQRESYPFELSVAKWPPSYQGNHINVDHYIDARAKIPWAFDPKASHEFVMRPVEGPGEAEEPSAGAIGGCIGYGLVILIFSLVLFGVGMLIVGLATNALAAIIVSAVAIPIIGLIAAKTLLPRWLLGKVDAQLITPQVAPGGRARAKLAFQPRRSVNLNAITAELSGKEICVSGSGSNRTTHRNTFFTDVHTLQGASTLQPGDRREFNLEIPIPDDVPYSFDLADNDLKWSIELRVDIPRWPDWTQSLPLLVMPDGQMSPLASESNPDVAYALSPAATQDAQSAAADRGITFEETASHLWASRDDTRQIDALVAAVDGMTFDIDAFVERRLLYSGEEDPHVYKDGYAVWARYSEPPLPLVLYIPHEMGDEFEQAGRDLWRCRGTIVGWDHQHRRLQIKVLGR